MTDEELTQEYVKESFDYFKTTGLCRWRVRPDHHFASKMAADRWNKRYAGKICGCIKKNWDKADHEEGGYVVFNLGNKVRRLHRIIWIWMTGSLPKNQIDHINGNRADNRWENLREVTNKENHKNCKMFSHNTSGKMGVHKEKKSGKFMAHIKVDQKFIFLGYFDNFDMAASARDKAEIEYGFHEQHGKR